MNTPLSAVPGRLAAAMVALVLASGFALGQAPGAGAAPPADQQVAPKPAVESPLLDLHGAWRQGRDPRLLQALDEHVEWILKNNPIDASQRGDERYGDQLGDPSPAGVLKANWEAAHRLKYLARLPVGRMSEVDRLDLDLIIYDLSQRVDAARFHLEELAVDAQSGPQVSLPQMCDSLPFTRPKHYADYAARLERIPQYLEGWKQTLRAGLADKRVPPKVALNGVADQCFMLATDDVKQTPSLSPFYKPFRALPAGDANAARARAAIGDGIVPAFKAFGEFIQNEYLPKCRDSIACSDGVDGRAAYDLALRRHTTTDLSADKIHEIGLAEVARIHAEMMAVIARTDYPNKTEYQGDALFHAFVEYLRTDKRFYYDKPEDLLNGYRDICKRMDAELPRLFGRLPRLSYGVRELPPLVAPTAPTAYYYLGSMKAGVPGWFMANTYRLDQRPKFEMTALALHESVPGHHLQISLSQELEGQHPFHTFTNYTAFVEGWGLYSESLGLEVGDADRMDATEAKSGAGGSTGGDSQGVGSASTRRNMYSDPYDDFGRLSYEMWRACRLVVDTGIHAQGWTRQRAIDYMLANTALARHNIEREVDRYIAWPGQACAYKIGQMKISALRAKAEKALGERFNLREFHDTVLSSGSIPLPTLEGKIDRWIASKGE
ncbi:MAG TPA: DUF885 domain-containing protein [Phycisphaerales bacterium]|nr:DUF885 domain-containing protein [Phycisphaerales bacterium]